MSITGFYDALSVKNLDREPSGRFSGVLCSIQFAHNQETFMISVRTCMHVQYIRGIRFFFNNFMDRSLPLCTCTVHVQFPVDF
jgi:hypothetical protein